MHTGIAPHLCSCAIHHNAHHDTFLGVLQKWRLITQAPKGASLVSWQTYDLIGHKLPIDCHRP